MWGGCTGVVVDAGSRATKAGFASEAFPRAVLPTVTARFRHEGVLDGLPYIYVGKEAILNRGLSGLIWPVQKGLVQDWDEMEKLWHHLFYRELHAPPEQCNLMHGIHPLATRRDKERMSEILFECFTVNGLYVMKSPVLVLHASGRTSGVAWEAGAGCACAAPVFEGFPLAHAATLSPLTGDLLSTSLRTLLASSGYHFSTPYEMELLDTIKAQHCYMSVDYDAAIKSSQCSGENKKTHVLPDGQKILLGDERIHCPEVLFKPTIAGLECPNVIEIINSSISKCDFDYRSTFYENIVVAGGCSMFPGLVERLKVEIVQSVLKNNQPYKVNIEAPPSRQYAAWLGGSILASLDILKDFWMTRQEYEDGGVDRVKYKFF